MTEKYLPYLLKLLTDRYLHTFFALSMLAKTRRLQYANSELPSSQIYLQQELKQLIMQTIKRPSSRRTNNSFTYSLTFYL